MERKKNCAINENDRNRFSLAPTRTQNLQFPFDVGKDFRYIIPFLPAPHSRNLVPIVYSYIYLRCRRRSNAPICDNQKRMAKNVKEPFAKCRIYVQFNYTPEFRWFDRNFLCKNIEHSKYDRRNADAAHIANAKNCVNPARLHFSNRKSVFFIAFRSEIQP